MDTALQPKTSFESSASGASLTDRQYAQLARQAKFLTRKKELLATGLADHPRSAQLWSMMAVTSSKLRHDLDAERAFSIVYTMTPNSPQMLMEYMRFATKIKKYDLAETLAARLISIEGFTVQALTALGHSYLMQDKLKLARGCFGYALTQDLTDKHTLKRLREVESLSKSNYSPRDFTLASTRIAQLIEVNNFQDIAPKTPSND